MNIITAQILFGLMEFIGGLVIGICIGVYIMRKKYGLR